MSHSHCIYRLKQITCFFFHVVVVVTKKKKKEVKWLSATLTGQNEPFSSHVNKNNEEQTGSYVQFVFSKWKCCRRTVTMETDCRGMGGGGVTPFAPLKLQLLGCRFSTATPPPSPLLSGSLHGGASWMQISDRRLVGATLEASSHWAQTFWCVQYLFSSQPSDHFRHAANPKIVWRNDKRYRSLKTEQMCGT